MEHEQPYLLGYNPEAKLVGEYNDRAKALRAKLASTLATITVLLRAQTNDFLSNSESDRVKSVQQTNDGVSSQSRILTALKNLTRKIADGQDSLATEQSHLTAMGIENHQDLQSLKLINS